MSVPSQCGVLWAACRPAAFLILLNDGSSHHVWDWVGISGVAAEEDLPDISWVGMGLCHRKLSSQSHLETNSAKKGGRGGWSQQVGANRRRGRGEDAMTSPGM